MAKRFLCYDTNNPKGVTPDGVLDSSNLGCGTFTVTITINEDDTYSADKTFDEIVAAYNSGLLCIARYEDEYGIYQMNSLDVFDNLCAKFVYTRFDLEYFYVIIIDIMNDGTVDKYTYEYVISSQ